MTAEPAKAIKAIVEIVNQRGLHARASAKFVELVARHDAEVTVSKDGNSVSGRSIMGLMMLGAGKGSAIELSATGVDAAKVMSELVRLIRDRFHEDQ